MVYLDVKSRDLFYYVNIELPTNSGQSEIFMFLCSHYRGQSAEKQNKSAGHPRQQVHRTIPCNPSKIKIFLWAEILELDSAGHISQPDKDLFHLGRQNFVHLIEEEGSSVSLVLPFSIFSCLPPSPKPLEFFFI